MQRFSVVQLTTGKLQLVTVNPAQTKKLVMTEIGGHSPDHHPNRIRFQRNLEQHCEEGNINQILGQGSKFVQVAQMEMHFHTATYHQCKSSIRVLGGAAI